MTERKDGGPAYPFEYNGPDMWGEGTERHLHPGMSLRDHFAGQALAGMGAWMPPHGGDNLSTIQAMDARAVWAYEQADAMLRVRLATGEREDG